MTPLKTARLAMGWSLLALAQRLARAGITTDHASLSRLERGKHTATASMAEKLALVFGENNLSEMQVLYPERDPQKKRVA